MDPNQRLQGEVEKVLNGLDKSTLRPMRREAFLCSAKCCEDGNSTPEMLQQCVQRCQKKVEGAEQVMSQELEMFQQRLQRCAMTCSDNVQMKVPTDPAHQTPELLASLQAESTVCANKCVDSHIGDLAKISERVKVAIKSFK